jgi:cation diffusion facilitator CzcD-associated flavoprotein CzcO
MDGNVLTISRGTWMELANLGFRQWEESRYLTTSDRHLGARQKRASVVNVARYYHDYVDIKGLRPHFRDSAEVTSVRRIDSVDGLWQVKGHIQTAGGLEDFNYVTPNVVLAIGGYDLPNQINVSGENLPFVVKSLSTLEQLITSHQLTAKSDPVLIVGAGLSAADAIIAAHFRGIPIIHAFRRKADDPSLIFRQLPSNMYPEYHKVYSVSISIFNLDEITVSKKKFHFFLSE